MTHPLRNLLNRLRWDKDENAENYLITYRHRGAPGDVKQVKASEIKSLGKSYFTLQEGLEDETLIPFHRILEIRNTVDDSILWVSRKARSSGA
jgi:uncharacterized protein (UPF0248 family)